MSNRILPSYITRDMIFGGDGYVAGTTKIDAAPDIPVARKVRLFDGKTGQLVREKWSGTDGAYSFDRLARSAQQRYFAASFDHTEAYNAVIADRIAADPFAAGDPSGIILDAHDSGAAAGSPPASLDYWKTLHAHFESLTDDGGDPYWNSVVLAMHMDGANDGTVFTDAKGRSISRTGSPVTKTDVKKFGAASGYFDGDNDYLGMGGTLTDFNFGTAPFTIDAWCYCQSGSVNGALLSSSGLWSAGANVFYVSDDHFRFASFNIANPVLIYSYDFTTQWNHVALVRNGTSVKLFLNGNEVASATISAAAAIDFSSGGGTRVARTGWGLGPDESYKGWIDDLRVTKGVARYTADFTPPDQAFYEYIGPRKIDDRGNIVVVGGGADVGAAQFKFGAKSLVLDGTGDYLDWTSPAAFGVAPFTIEGWIRISTPLSGFMIFDSRDTETSALGVAFHVTTAGKLAVKTNNVVTAGTTTLAADTWYHVALVRSLGTLRCYLEGAQECSVANTANMTTTGWRIGHNFNAAGAYSAGYIDELRITNGVGRYAGAFTPATEAFAD